jgi:hypothetical protein
MNGLKMGDKNESATIFLSTKRESKHTERIVMSSDDWEKTWLWSS